jgi:hypothetical protein
MTTETFQRRALFEVKLFWSVQVLLSISSHKHAVNCACLYMAKTLEIFREHGFRQDIDHYLIFAVFLLFNTCFHVFGIVQNQFVVHIHHPAKWSRRSLDNKIICFYSFAPRTYLPSTSVHAVATTACSVNGLISKA